MHHQTARQPTTPLFRRLTTGALVAAVLVPAATLRAQTPVTERVLQIGQFDGPPHYSLGEPQAVHMLPGERLLVVDGQTALLHVYDMQGQHLFTVGGRGSGPGEFERPQNVVVTPPEFAVFDARLQRLSRFSLDGTHVATSRIPGEYGIIAGALRLRGGRWFGQLPPSISSSHIQQVIRGETRAGGTGIGRVVLFDSARIDTLASYASGSVFWYEAEGRAFGGIPGFGAGLLVATHGDSTVVIVDTHRGRITWFRGTEGGLTPVHNLDLGLAPRAITARDRQELERGVRDSDMGRRYQRIGFILPEQRAHFRQALLDDTGAVWLQRDGQAIRGADEAPVFLVVGPDGTQREVRLPTGFTLRSVHSGLLLGTARSEFDIPLVQAYRLPR